MLNAPPALIVVTDWSLGSGSLLDRLRPVLALGPRVAIQHRHPQAPFRVFLEEARALAALCSDAGVPLFINGRLDVALLLDAHLHLPARGPRAVDCRRLLPTRWISAAVHSAEEARAASGADVALLSPVFAPGSKPQDTRPRLGPEGFHALAAMLAGPLPYALGGITPATARGLGAAGLTVQSAVLDAPHPRAAAEALLEAAGTRSAAL